MIRSLVIFFLLGLSIRAERLPATCHQLVLAIAPAEDSTVGQMLLLNKVGSRWIVVGSPMRVFFGASGLAWGRGLTRPPDKAVFKVEGDQKAPSGIFAIGKIFTYDQSLPEGADYPFHTITENDAWVDDPRHPDYNRHVILSNALMRSQWQKHRMRLNDPPHRWLIEIRHNADPPLSGAGSAIFFHIARGPDVPSAGCTVMAKENLLRLIRWLRASAHPHYALLTREDYLNHWRGWSLPPPSRLGSLVAVPEGL